MRVMPILVASLVVLACVVASMPAQEHARIYLDKSVPYVGAGSAWNAGYEGRGITIAVIDTGIDSSHPDLAGMVLSKHSLVGGTTGDTNGHGTQVAGIIAANGNVRGMAPESRLISYKVSEDGESVASNTIADAIYMAIRDGADIINISLGVNRTNTMIDDAVDVAAERGILVVVAAGNDGPDAGSIGSPGGNPRAVTVGATYNNITNNLIATLTVGEKQYRAIPMLGIIPTETELVGSLAYAKYARERDMDGSMAGKILVAERGSDVPDEIVYFAEKEHNAANAGAAAIIVFNNEPGHYLGDVSESATIRGYEPRIPILSISREDGMEIKNSRDTAAVSVFHNSDQVTFFSSRGPVSPFTIKPDMVAPGAYINTTDSGGYYISSGTSFATPHVSGAAALLMEKYPDIKPEQIKSMLVASSSPVSDPYGTAFSPDIAGAGRLDVTRLLSATLATKPPALTIIFSPTELHKTGFLKMEQIGDAGPVSVGLDMPDHVTAAYHTTGDTIMISAKLDEASAGMAGPDRRPERHAIVGHGGIVLTQGGVEHVVPVILRYAQGSITMQDAGDGVAPTVTHPKDWTYAKITISNQNHTGSMSITPHARSTITAPIPGEYEVEAAITFENGTVYAYDVVRLGAAAHTFPDRQYLIVLGMALAVVLAGVGIRGARRRRSSDPRRETWQSYP